MRSAEERQNTLHVRSKG